MRRTVGWMLLFLACCATALASGEDSRAQYLQAKAQLEQGAYRQAYESFEALADYEDSALYAQYVLALYSVDSGCWDRAETLWIPLAQRAFFNSNDWLTYTQARHAEAEGDQAAAATLYARAQVADAFIRLAALERGWDAETIDEGLTPPVLRQDESQDLTLCWDEVPGADGYAIYRSEGEGQDLRLIAVVVKGEAGYADQGACAGLRYRYGIKALTRAGASALSNLLEVDKAREPSLRTLALAQRDATSLEVCWEGTDSGAGYAVYATVSGLWRVVAGTSGTWAHSHVLEGLVPGTAYTVYVQDKQSGDHLSARITLEAAPNFRAYAYHWQLCRVVQQVPNNGKLRWHGISTLTQAELSQKETPGACGLQLNFTWETSQAEKALSICVVLRTPGGDAFTQYDEFRCAGTTAAVSTVFSLEGLMEKAAAGSNGWEPGEYQCELYFDGGFAGRASFAVQ